MKRSKRNKRKTPGANRSKRPDTSSIESYSSPKVWHTDENVRLVFSVAVFIISALLVFLAAYSATGSIDVWGICLSLAISILLAFTIRITPQWERAVVLRLGKFHRVAGPGIYLTIPLIDHVALHADQRIMLIGFGAEETLTADLVPVNVDAAVFWMVWDVKKACLEVEDYYDSVAVAAQTALRDAIGRQSIADIALSRIQLDQELKDAIEEKASVWGVSILFVEIRDIVIPKELQKSMAAEASAERERDARIVLSEVERDIASMLHEASDIYRDDEIALKLRQMHLLNENMKESKGSILIPSAYVEGFSPDSRT